MARYRLTCGLIAIALAGCQSANTPAPPAPALAAPAASASPPQRAISRAMPTKDEQACLQAVSIKTNNGEVQLMMGTETSEANNAVYIGVGPNRAIWRCLEKGGRVTDVSSMTDEGWL